MNITIPGNNSILLTYLQSFFQQNTECVSNITILRARGTVLRREGDSFIWENLYKLVPD